MAVALSSGCDFFSYWSTAPADVVGTLYNSSASGGSTGPAAGTHMSFVGQYIGVVTSGQLGALNAAGLSVFFYYENSNAGSIQPSFAGSLAAAIANTTYAQGVTDAQYAQHWLVSQLGLPANHPVYFTIDYDAGAASFPNLINYFQGNVDTIGSSANVGIYSNGYACTQINLGLNSLGYPALGYFVQTRSSGWSGNGTYLGATTGTTQNLWQWPPGYTPGGNVTINGHGVDGVFAYTTDFGQFPSSGGGGSGILTVASVTQPTIAFTQPQPQAIIVPTDSYDNVIFSKTFKASVTASSWPQTVSGPATGINQYAYPIGNYSANVNGGPNSTNDFGFIFSGDYGSYVGNLPQVVVQPIVDGTGALSFDVTANATSGSITVNLSINIALLKTSFPSYIPATSVQQNTAYSNEIPNGNPSKYSTYRRIAKDSVVGTGNTTVAHKQSTIPNILVWALDNTGTIEMQPTSWGSTGSTGHFGISMDATNVYFSVDAGLNNNAYYRIYQDN